MQNYSFIKCTLNYVLEVTPCYVTCPCSAWNFDRPCRRLGLSRINIKRLIFHIDTMQELAKLLYLPQGSDEYLLRKKWMSAFCICKNKKIS